MGTETASPSLGRRSLLALAAGALLSPRGTRAAGRASDVLVLGAGIAGLRSAQLLEEAGATVTVLEGRERLGGRLWTLDTVPGRPEAGGQTLGFSYARTFALMEELGLARFPRRPFASGLTIARGGELVTDQRWPESALNPLTGPLRALRPDRLYGHLLRTLGPVPELVRWDRPAFRSLDAESVADLLRRSGAQEAALPLMEVAFDGLGLDRMSALFACRKQLAADLNAEGQSWRVSGGSQRLPEAIAERLRGPVLTGKEVTALVQDARGCEARCADGTRYRAERVLCSLPLPALRRVALDPAPPPPLATLVQGLTYNPITQVQLVFDRAFWEDDGLPPQLWSDHPLLERVFAVPAEDGELHTLNCWFNGAGARRVDRLAPQALLEAIPRALGELRPASRGHLRVSAVTAWGRDRFAGGAYHSPAPGQALAVAEILRAPFGRVRFIGEHVARFQQGIEGALEAAGEQVYTLLSGEEAHG